MQNKNLISLSIPTIKEKKDFQDSSNVEIVKISHLKETFLTDLMMINQEGKKDFQDSSNGKIVKINQKEKIIDLKAITKKNILNPEIIQKNLLQIKKITKTQITKEKVQDLVSEKIKIDLTLKNAAEMGKKGLIKLFFI